MITRKVGELIWEERSQSVALITRVTPTLRDSYVYDVTVGTDRYLISESPAAGPVTIAKLSTG